MRELKRKLILSVFSMIATIVCLTSTTYAWFARNENAWTDDFKIDMGANDNLAISIDGINFGNQLTTAEIKKAIASKRTGISVTKITDEAVESNYGTELQPVSTRDLKNFTTVDRASLIDKETNTYIPREADLFSFISFDVYFKIDGKSSKNYKLALVSNKCIDNGAVSSSQGLSYIKNNSLVKEITLDNELSLPGGDKLSSGDKIKVDPLNAMRIGFIGDTTVDNEVVIYEPYEGIGSYAIDKATEDKYNPDMNPMLTYFNNKNSAKLKPLDNDEFYYNTLKDFEAEKSLGYFTRDLNQYNVLKLTVGIWLDGYDADYFYGVDVSSFTFFLNFVKIDLGGNEE